MPPGRDRAARAAASGGGEPGAAPVFPWPAPAFGVPVALVPGIWWLTLPLPWGAGQVAAWLLRGGDGWTIVDCGLDDAPTRAIWEGLLAGFLADAPVVRLVATHGHNDHIGLAGWLCARTGAAFHITRTEWLTAQARHAETPESLWPAAGAYYLRHGYPAEAARAALARGVALRAALGPLPPRFLRLVDGQRIALGAGTWRVAAAGGHAPEHAMFRAGDGRVLIAGDQLLSHTAPPISLPLHEPEGNPLGEYLDLLAALGGVGADVLVLPSHGLPYYGLPARLAGLRTHVGLRLTQMLAAARTPRTALEICGQVYSAAAGRGQMNLAFAQTLSHLNYLRAEGLGVAEPGPGGLWRFRALDNIAPRTPHFPFGLAATPQAAAQRPLHRKTDEV